MIIDCLLFVFGALLMFLLGLAGAIPGVYGVVVGVKKIKNKKDDGWKTLVEALILIELSLFMFFNLLKFIIG